MAADVSSHEDSIPRIMARLLSNLVNLAKYLSTTKLVKIAKGIGQILLLFFEISLILVFLLVFLIRTTSFQTYLAKKATTYLSKELGTKVNIDKIDIIFFDRLDLEGVFAEDINNDTLLSAGQINVNISDWDLKQKYVIIDNVTLSNASVNLNKQAGDSTFNFQHIVDLFASEEDTDKSEFNILVNQISLDNVNFNYDDYSANPLSFGIDYSHLAIQNLKGSITDFSYQDAVIQSRINNLSFKDKSGFELKNLSTLALYSSELISLKELDLSLSESNLRADHLELISKNGAVDFKDFLNQVEFDAHLKNTKIAIRDLAYFVPKLEGMTDTISIVNAVLDGAVNGMKLNDVDIRTLTKTAIKGNFQIPNLTDINSAFIDQRIALFQTSVNDIETLNLGPFLENQKHISLPSNLKGLSTIRLTDGHFTGFLSDFVVDGVVTTGLGNVYSDNGLKFKKQSNGIYSYEGSSNKAISRDVIVEQLNLGKLTGNKNLGIVNGYLQILPGSHGFSMNEIDLLFDGHFDDIVLNGYNYNNIKVRKGQFHDDRFKGEIDIEDDNLALVYDGYIDFKNTLEFNFDVRVDKSYLAKLKLLDGNLATDLKTKMHVNLKGSSLDDIVGDVKIEKLEYFDGLKTMDLSELDITIKRSIEEDNIAIKSSYIDGELKGKFDFSQIVPMLTNQVSSLIPNYLDRVEIPDGTIEDFVLNLTLIDVNPVLNFFDSAYYVEPNTSLYLESHLANNTSILAIHSDQFKFQNRVFKGIHLKHNLDSTKADINYNIGSIKISDSLRVDSFAFNSVVKNNTLATNFGWIENEQIKSAEFEMLTELRPKNDIFTKFSSSYFYLQNSRWELLNGSSMLWNPEYIDINNVVINNDNHYIKLDGKVSEKPNDWLNIDIKDFDLSELNGFFGGDLTLEGVLNLQGGVADLYNNIRAKSDAGIKDLTVNSELVGDLSLNSKWDKTNNAIGLLGDLVVDNVKRFDFKGYYYVDRTSDNLDLDLVFDHTDIAFLNAFSDPDLYTNIRGNLDGNLSVKGELDNPIIIGDLMVEPTTVRVPMFNVDYRVSGLLNFNKGEILADYLEITDQLGNKGVGMMSVNHTNYSNWNYDVTLDFEDPNITKTFLAMDTYYKEGDVYYGKAFVTGNVNIFGYDNLTEINVDLKTKKGTNLTLPLYGTSEIEESSFLRFYNPDTLTADKSEVKIERLGMTLNMNFKVTDEATVNIVFDPILNDQIEANGSGDIEMKMDDYGDISMFGKYTIHKGMYHFNMKNVVKEDFEIIDGSTVTWTQSPYDANIDIETRFLRNVDMSDILSSDIGQTGKKDQVFGYLNLSNTLMSPVLEFDILAPQARDEAKAALNQIRAIEDDLNKQFFSLLLLKKFIPVEGSIAASGNVTEDIVNQQINAVLGQIGENYNLNSDIGTDHAELGFSTSFLDNRLKITSSVGVISSDETDGETGAESKASNIVGDVNVEYELNEDGTFTVSVFNESNDVANQDRGAFTQGFGFSYQESFNSKRDFKLLQGFLNIFRKQENKRQRRNKNNGRKTPVQDDFKPTAPLEKETE
ncbi:MAG: translocation/assembly module TamB domain-containing protein [Crocinitomicaceae bacterium]